MCSYHSNIFFGTLEIKQPQDTKTVICISGSKSESEVEIYDSDEDEDIRLDRRAEEEQVSLIHFNVGGRLFPLTIHILVS